MAVATYVHREAVREQQQGETEEEATSCMSDAELFSTFLLVLCFFCPFLAVFLERGCGVDLLLNFLLTLLGVVPGILHALYILFRYENGIVYNRPEELATDEPQLTVAGVFRDAREENDKSRLHRRRTDVEPDKFDGDDSLSRAPSYRTTRSGPPAYGADVSEDEMAYSASAQLSEKQRGKRRMEIAEEWV